MKIQTKDLTLDEKLLLLTGDSVWTTNSLNGKLKSIWLSDGPHGLRKLTEKGWGSWETTVEATAMPNLSLVSNSWDKELFYLMGSTLADDCIDNNVDVLLAPGVNIKRTPLCGRNFEYVSEDPFLAGTLAKEYIDGIQNKGVGTSLKHFALNNREYDRLYQSSDVDERTMMEIYFRAFEIALRAKPWTVMCSYNPVNGVYASENKKLLDTYLRKTLGFDGVIVSDWGAVHNRYKALKATLDLEMPNSDAAFNNLKNAYEKGLITDQEIDSSVDRILALIEKTENDKKKTTTNKAERHQNAVKIAAESMVLLKNEDNLLPIKNGQSVAVAGMFANNPPMGGGGSAIVKTAFKQEPFDKLLKDKLPNSEIKQQKTWEGGVDRNRNLKEKIINAYGADVSIICIGNDSVVESEDFDRITIKLRPNQINNIKEIAKANENTVVLLYAGSAVDVSDWIDDVKALLLVGFAGEGANEAITDILTGKVCPSGKLTETYPVSIEDTYCEEFMGNGGAELYSDGIFVGYRYYDASDAQVMFPFGYGLSYANFTYSDLEVIKTGDTDFTVRYKITNNSNIDAKEISEVYVKDVVSMVIRPEKELKGFSKDLIKAGETKTVEVKLDFSSFAYYSTAFDKWHVENGDFEILVGSSSQDILLKGKVKIDLPNETQQSNEYDVY